MTGADSTPRPTAVDEFLDGLAEPRRALVAAVDETIRGAAPELAVAVDGRFLGYGPFHYRYASGREGDTFAVSMMSGAQALSVYVLGADGDRYLAEANAERLGKVSVGKSCIRVKRIEHLDLDVLAELVRRSADQLASGALGT